MHIDQCMTKAAAGFAPMPLQHVASQVIVNMRLTTLCLPHLCTALPRAPQALSALCHVLRLLDQAARDGQPVPWVVLELVSHTSN